jgi:hypothetical protein
MNTELKSFTTLKTQSELMLRASRKNDKAINKDSSTLSPLIVDYMNEVRDNGEWSLARITATIYDAVGYDSKAVDKQGESMKSPSFETRVKRATFDALLEFYQVNPFADAKEQMFNENGYKRNSEGELTLPHNVLKPTIEEEIDGEKQELPNNDTTRIKVVARLREKHFGQVFKGMSRRPSSNQGKTDYIKIANDLDKHLRKLKDTEIFDFSDEDIKILQSLENTLNTFFETRTTLVSTKEGNVINTAVK